jgi:uncharacterized damage-inducible protein DinB
MAEQLSEDQLNTRMRKGQNSISITLVHMLSAEWIWCMRWQGVSPQAMLSPQDFPTLQQIRERWQQEEQQMRTLFLIDSVLEWNTTLRCENILHVSWA